MGRTATIIAASYAVACALALVPVVGVALSTRSRRPTDTQKLAEREKTWFVVVVVLLVGLLFATIFFTPYARGVAKHSQAVDVQAQQFAWTGLSKPIEAGREVEFRLTSKDVNHAFAVYTRGGKLLFQVQVMPGKTQVYRYTFKHPGTYTVLCFEFCGVGHDAMRAKLTVTR